MKRENNRVRLTTSKMSPLRINFKRIFKVLTKLPESQSNEDNFRKTLKIQVKLFLNYPMALAITCLSNKGQNF